MIRALGATLLVILGSASADHTVLHTTFTSCSTACSSAKVGIVTETDSMTDSTCRTKAPQYAKIISDSMTASYTTCAGSITALVGVNECQTTTPGACACVTQNIGKYCQAMCSCMLPPPPMTPPLPPGHPPPASPPPMAPCSGDRNTMDSCATAFNNVCEENGQPGFDQEAAGASGNKCAVCTDAADCGRGFILPTDLPTNAASLPSITVKFSVDVFTMGQYAGEKLTDFNWESQAQFPAGYGGNLRDGRGAQSSRTGGTAAGDIAEGFYRIYRRGGSNFIGVTAAAMPIVHFKKAGLSPEGSNLNKPGRPRTEITVTTLFKDATDQQNAYGYWRQLEDCSSTVCGSTEVWNTLKPSVGGWSDLSLPSKKNGELLSKRIGYFDVAEGTVSVWKGTGSGLPPPPPFVAIKLTAAGAVSDYDEAMKAKIVNTAVTTSGVTPIKTAINITAGSVNIVITLTVGSAEEQTAAKTAIDTAFATPEATAALLAAGGVTVVIEAVSVATGGGGGGGGGSIGIIIAAVAGVIVLLILIVVVMKMKKKKSVGYPKTSATSKGDISAA